MKRGAQGPPPGVYAPLTRQQEGWVERGMAVVTRCARAQIRKWGSRVTYEEMLSLGSLGLMQAVRTYDPDRGTDFEVYCYKRIDGAMRYGIKKDSRFYALVWDAGYAHLETTQDEGPSLDDDDGSGDVAALQAFSDRLMTAIARKLCGSASMMEASSSEEAVVRRAEWTRRLQVFSEELERTPSEGRELLRLVYDEDLDLKAAGAKMSLNYGQTRRLQERTIDDLGARVRRRCALEPPD